MKKDDTSPATKQDVALIMDTMAKVFDEVYGVKGQMLGLKEELRLEFNKGIEESQRSILHQTGLWIEILRSDVLDMKKDQVARHQDWLEDHDRRIERLEQKVGV